MLNNLQPFLLRRYFLPKFHSPTFSGNSSLHFAVKGAHFKIALFLLESGAGVNMQNKILQTPLFLAVRYKCTVFQSLVIVILYNTLKMLFKLNVWSIVD